ncbi:hypothetical protein GCM10011608_55860 [Micromonospora sonchi]|uniref:Uncharacterized protein n=1 Tax=Micromonospora sonchi TaxID=1763543 RepID=A0A917U8Z4_9ACTN|nr:hypothetical protein [Micromonospora sonchi]GGM63436.1 hypothetical protein GCM10011608_55860 [Micromonospora sonchi]
MRTAVARPGVSTAVGLPARRRCRCSEQDRQSDRWLRLADRNAVAILDDELLYLLASRNVQLAREAGALTTLPDSLRFLSITSGLMGELARAGEAPAITQATGGVQLWHAHVILSAWRGDQAETTALNAITAQDVAFSDEGTEAALAQYAMAVPHNGRGNYPAAQDAAARAWQSQELSLSNLVHFELIESAARAGLRRVATPRTPTPGRPRTAPHRPRAAVGHGRGGVRRARRPRITRHR